MNIPVNTPLIGDKEKVYLMDCLDSGWVGSDGKYVTLFENAMANYVDRKFGISVSNGSAALDVALKSLQLVPGDEVIVPTFTIISPVQSIITAGAIPVFVDSNPVTYSIDVTKIEKRITSKTKAILAVHIYGFPCDMDPIMELAQKYSLIVIEDAAEMHGQEYKGKKCGSFGLISIFSFFPNKHITTGEGGMIMTDDSLIAERCKYYKNLCFNSERRFLHHDLGWNYRMSNIQAALGLGQLETISEKIKIKREVGNYYYNQFKKFELFELQPLKTDYSENIFWVNTIVLKDDFPHDAKWFMDQLNIHGIGTRPFFYCMHLQPVLKNYFLNSNYLNGEFSVAEKIMNRGFYIPSGLNLNSNELEYIVENVKKIYNSAL
jgi:perosamine synthetase